MAILVNSGRAAAAAAILAKPIHMAWGTGAAAWDATPASEQATATALINEIGRRRVTQAQFCEPEPDTGPIVVPQGRFRPSTVPTKYLHMTFAFDFTDAEAAIIRELAIFVDTKVKASVPPGQMYFIPSEVEHPGLMLALEHVTRFERDASVRQQFEFVIQL